MDGKMGGITGWVKLAWMGVILSLLIGCAPAGKLQATPSASATPEPSQTRTPTRVPSATRTRESTRTSSPLAYTSTRTYIPTYDPNQALTGLGPEDCPGYQFTGSAPDFDFIGALKLVMDQGGQKDLELILDYLNHYGMDALKQSDKKGYEKFADLTGDGLNELLYSGKWLSFMIIGCQAGKYQVLETIDSQSVWPAHVELIGDVNHDGINEIVYLLGTTSQGGHAYEVDEWDGREFKDIVALRESDNEAPGNLSVNATGRIGFKDINGDGVQELILHRGVQLGGEVWRDFGPWRDATDTYKWDGHRYVFSNEEWTSPEYRFQSVQDGDRLFKKGELERALGMYQLTITSPTLKLWSSEIVFYHNQVDFMTPTEAALVPVPQEDKNAYVALSAYAYFRIMLIYLIQGHEAEAYDVYTILETRNITNKNGEVFGLLAQSFWDEYLASKNLALACQKAAAFTDEHRNEVLRYLGNAECGHTDCIYYGSQSLHYEPEDICPVK